MGTGGAATGGGGAATSALGGASAASDATSGGASGAAASASGGTAGGVTGGAASGGSGGRSGTGGTMSGGAGRANGGAAGASAGSGSGGGSGGGQGGSGACVPNLACKLNPPPTTGDLYQDCVDRINQFRTQCACLPALARRQDGEACADQMAEYDAQMNSPHAGARAQICQPGGAQNECPGYSSNSQVIGLCMQQMWDEGPPPTTPCTDECFNTHGHFINMTDTSMKKVACGFYATASGKVWAVQNFTR